MRKLLIVSLLCLLLSLSHEVEAAEYFAYQEIKFTHKGAKFLDTYTEENYDTMYDKLDKRIFFGWKTKSWFRREPVTYTKETLYVIINEGDTAITETFDFEYEDSVKKQFNVSGNIKLQGSGSKQTIKGGLEQNLSNSITATTTTSSSQSFNIKVHVDPDTKLYVEILGEGKVSNGVAKFYCFWRVCKKGGWEVFIVTTEYYSIRKERL